MNLFLKLRCYHWCKLAGLWGNYLVIRLYVRAYVRAHVRAYVKTFSARIKKLYKRVDTNRSVGDG